MKIMIDCPPGITRPLDILSEIIQGTGLTLDDFTLISQVFGEFTWSVVDIKEEIFKNAREYLLKELEENYYCGRIRCAEIPKINCKCNKQYILNCWLCGGNLCDVCDNYTNVDSKLYCNQCHA